MVSASRCSASADPAASLSEVEVFEDVQHQQQLGAAAGRRRRVHGGAPVGADQRRALDGAVGGEVFAGDQAAMATHVGVDPRCDLALVEGVRATARNLRQSPRELRLAQLLAAPCSRCRLP
jgi:hypothetical protein